VTTSSTWKVEGIVAQKQKQRAKAVVLSDSPNGVEWGMGAMTGSIEDGLLVWRRSTAGHTGEVKYTWTRPGPERLDSPLSKSGRMQEPKTKAALRSRKRMPSSAKGEAGDVVKGTLQKAPAQLSSPRSASSDTSTAPTDTSPFSVYSPEMKLGKMQTTPQEVTQLLEMANNRLAFGDFGAAMRYVSEALDLPDEDDIGTTPGQSIRGLPHSYEGGGRRN
jgi:hypothetical protein